MAMIEHELELKDARDQLSMVLGFFPRVDAKLSTVLAIDTAMLAALTASAPQFQIITILDIVVGLAAIGLLCASYCFLYLGGFPTLKGGHSSLIYFKDIAARNEAKFIEEYEQKSCLELRTDILSQVWRNSEILFQKFRYLRRAFICMAFGAVPWSFSLAMFAMQRSHLQVVASHL